MERHNLKGVGGCGNGSANNHPFTERVVGAEGTLRLMAIGWDMAGEAEESLAYSALPQSAKNRHGRLPSISAASVSWSAQ
jgi:hypothetical protein